MTNDTAQNFHKRALLSATKFGFAQHREDIAQEVLCRFAAGKGRHQTIDQAVIDVIREDFGRTTLPGFQARSALRNASSIVEVSDRPSPLPLPDNRVGFDGFIDLLSGNERTVVVLTYLWGLNEKEIGYCLGVTESRACQIKKGAEARLRKKLSFEEQRDSERQSSRKISHEIQDRPRVEEKTKRKLEEIQSKANEAQSGVGASSRPEVQKEVPRSFRVNTF